MRTYTTSSQSNDHSHSRRDGGQTSHNDGGGGGGVGGRNKNHNHNNNNNNQRNFERKRDNTDKREQRQNQYQSRDRNQAQGDRDRSTNRDRSGQRGGQHPDSSMGRESMNMTNLGSVKFTPGFSTRELPPIETKPDPGKKFAGRCRLFVGNLPHNTTDDQVKSLFEPFGEIGEIYLGPKSSFAFVKMDTRQNAEAARDALDCSNFEGRSLRVRLAAHAAAIKVKHLSPVVTNELLAYAFRYFGEIERAVVIVDDKGKSTGEGIVEYSKKQSAQFAIKRCQQECFMLTQAPVPVLVEPYDQQDDDEGLPEKSINKHTETYKEQRDVGPRFAEQGSFEHSFALRWKDLYQVEKQKREHLEQEIMEARKNLQDSIEYSRLEHKTMELKNQLQQLADNKMKLQQIKDQTAGSAQEREEQRRQNEMMIRQREDEIFRRQQSNNSNFMNQQEPSLGAQLQEMINEASSNDQADQHNYQSNNTYLSQEPDQSGVSANPMLGSQGLGMPGPARSFSDAAILGMGFMQPPPMSGAPIPVSQGQQTVYSGYIPPPPLQSNLDGTQGVGNNINFQSQAFSTNSQFSSQGNNINLTGNNNGGRARKRGRF